MRRASTATPSTDTARTTATHATRPATLADEQKLYEVASSFVDRLPWAEYLEDSQCLLFDDARSVAAFFELQPIGTEGRDAAWLEHARDALENALQDSFDELEEQPWIVQFYVQDETSFDEYLSSLHAYVHPRARESAFTRFYLRIIEHHLRAVAKPGGFFRDNAVTHLPWRGRTRRVRMVIYRRVDESATRRGLSPEEALNTTCDRAVRG